MIFYHTTNPKAAEAIERDGFRDNTGFYMTDQEFTGVWVADIPLEELGPCGDMAVFESDSQSETLSEWEWVEERQN
jgi:hypothetical protein